MNHVIFKYPLAPNGRTSMPANAQILSVGVQGENVVCWARVDPTAPLVRRRLVAVPTGSAAPDATHNFCGTVQFTDRDKVEYGLVFHIFDGGEVRS